MPSVTSATACPCCCPPDGKKCFQEWVAGWSCAGQAWTGPVTDNRLCLPMGTDTGWVKTAGDATGCQYRIYVPYDPKHCCSANGDCGVELGDTATPALPFGGGEPPDCCDCTGCDTCPTDPDPGCCAPCPTPASVSITFVSVASGRCDWNTAEPYWVRIIDASGLVGRTFVLPFAGTCTYSETFDVTAWVRILQCFSEGPVGCGGCTPTADITDSAILTITWTTTGATTFSLEIGSTEPGFPPEILPFGFYTGNTVFFTNCCTAWSESGGGPDGSESVMSTIVTGITGAPCG